MYCLMSGEICQHTVQCRGPALTCSPLLHICSCHLGYSRTEENTCAPVWTPQYHHYDDNTDRWVSCLLTPHTSHFTAHTSLYHYPTQLCVLLEPRRRGRVDDGGVGRGPHTAPPPGPGSLPRSPEEDRTRGEGGEDPNDSDHLQPPHNILYPAFTAAIRSVSQASLASRSEGPSQVENARTLRSVME